MKRSRSFLAVAAVLVVGLCIAVYRAVQVNAEPVTSAAAAPHPVVAGGAESPEVGELRQELFRLRHQVASQEMRLTTADPGKAQAAPPDTGPEARAEAERKRKDYVAGLDAAFRKEVRDPQWSDATTSTVQSALAADEQLRVAGRGVECRSQTCRVEIADNGSLGKALPLFVHHVGPVLPTMTADRVVDGNGSATMVLYLSRNTTFPASP